MEKSDSDKDHTESKPFGKISSDASPDVQKDSTGDCNMETRETSDNTAQKISHQRVDNSVETFQTSQEKDILCDKAMDFGKVLNGCEPANRSSSDLTAENISKPSTEKIEMIKEAERKFLNERIANELLHDTKGKYVESLAGSNMESGKVAQIQAQIKSTMEKAFWDVVSERLTKQPPDYSQVIGLVKEVRDELDALVPQSWKQELHEAFDMELFAQILESRTKDVGYLAKLLDYALGLILKLEAPARDQETVSSHKKLVQDLSNIVSAADSDSNMSFELALVKGLRFILEQIQVLKKDIAAARVRAVSPLIRSPAGVEYMQKMFTLRHGPPSGAVRNLPKTVNWLAEVKNALEDEKNLTTCTVDSDENLDSSTSTSQGKTLHIDPSYPTGSNQMPMSIATLVLVGLLQIASRMVAADQENTPETLELNIERLRNVQNDFQRIVVIATSLLLVRQTLSEKRVPPAEVDDILNKASKRLDDILSDPLITIHHLGLLLANLCSSHVRDKAGIEMEFMTRILNRTLSSDDIVFTKVTSTVKRSVEAFLLLQKDHALCRAGTFLKRIGARFLRGHVENLADTLDVMASVSCLVHKEWYATILEEIKEVK